MKNSKTRKIIGSVLFTLLLVSFLVTSAIKVDALKCGGNITCYDIGCDSTAGCFGGGTGFNCTLHCENGASINCEPIVNKKVNILLKKGRESVDSLSGD
jgi:hypothetical protein